MSGRRLLKNSGIYGIVQILQKCIGLVLIPVYTTLLTPAEKGITDVVTPIVSFLSILYSLSINSAVIRFYVDYKEDKNKLKEFWGTCIVFVTLNSIALTTIFIIFRSQLLEPMAKGVDFFPYILLGMISITLNPIYTIFQSTLQAKEESKVYAKNNLLYFVVNLALNILFVVVLRIGAVGVLLSLAITDVIFFIYTVIKFIPRVVLKIKYMYLKQALKYSLPLLPHSLSGWAVSMLDRLFLNRYNGLQSPAIYSTGAQFGNIINVLTTAVNQAYVPWLFQKLKNKKENEKEIVLMSEVLTIFYAFLAMGMSLFGPEIFKIIVDKAYFEGWKVIPLLSFAFVFNGIYYFFVNPLFYNKKGVKFIAIGTFTGAILNSILNVILIPKFDIIGAATASLVSMMISCILVYFISIKIEPIKFNIFKLFSIAFIFLGISMLAFLLESLSFWTNILIKIVIVCVVILAIFLVYRENIMKLVNDIRNKKA